MIKTDELWNRVESLERKLNSNIVRVGFRRFRKGAIAPKQGTAHAAGSDLYACIDDDCLESDYHDKNFFEQYSNSSLGYSEYVNQGKTQITIQPNKMVVIPTGLNVRIPAGYEMQIRPRSGLAAKNQITVMNSPGTIDADYDGDGDNYEIRVMIKNTHATEPFIINHGDRICQAVVQRVPEVIWEEVFENNNNRLSSQRTGGLGSTGSS